MNKICDSRLLIFKNVCNPEFSACLVDEGHRSRISLVLCSFLEIPVFFPKTSFVQGFQVLRAFPEKLFVDRFD